MTVADALEKYNFTTRKLDTSIYLVRCNEIYCVVGFGSDEESARHDAKVALREHLFFLTKLGVPFPEPLW